MSNIWFTADNHFGHSSIIKYTNRSFSSVEEMDEIMIQRWNEVVKPNDVVYHLGDFTLFDFYAFDVICKQLYGKIVIIPGSHDHRWLDEMSEMKYSLDGITIQQSLLSLEFPSPEKYPTVFVLCHYALRVWDRSHYGSFHLYGHSHGKLPGLGRSMDVGVDGHDFYPWSLEEVVERLSKIEPHNGVKNE